jgi:hypothetical protein
MKTDHMWEAYYHAQQAANDLLVAHTIRAETGRVSPVYTEDALKHARQFAAYLGFDLVERKAAPVENLATACAEYNEETADAA